MASFLVDDWYARLQRIARLEVGRFMYVHRVNLDEDDAVAFAVSEAWIHISTLAELPSPSLWGYCRIIMRRRLISHFITHQMRVKRGGSGIASDGTKLRLEPARFVSFSLPLAGEGDDHAREDEYIDPDPALAFSPWAHVEDRITFDQLVALYRRHKKPPATPHKKKVSRERERQRREGFKAIAVSRQARKYDR